MGAEGDSNLVTTCKGRVWEDPAVYGINKRDAHVELNSFQSVESGVSYVRNIGRKLAKPPKCGKQVLDGKWHFKLFPSPDDVPADFVTGKKGDEWTQVRFFPFVLHLTCTETGDVGAFRFLATTKSSFQSPVRNPVALFLSFQCPDIFKPPTVCALEPYCCTVELFRADALDFIVFFNCILTV